MLLAIAKKQTVVIELLPQLNKHDLEQVAIRFAQDNPHLAPSVDKIKAEYLMYVSLSTKYGSLMVPSDDVDRFWHSHLLFTRNYREMCEIGGVFIDHSPFDKPLSQAEHDTRKREFVQIASDEFGEESPFTLENVSWCTGCPGKW